MNSIVPKKAASFCLNIIIIMNDKSERVTTDEVELEHAISQMLAY